jgi:hypothetical protein
MKKYIKRYGPAPDYVKERLPEQDWMPVHHEPGVYMICILPTRKVYIGESKDINRECTVVIRTARKVSEEFEIAREKYRDQPGQILCFGLYQGKAFENKKVRTDLEKEIIRKFADIAYNIRDNPMIGAVRRRDPVLAVKKTPLIDCLETRFNLYYIGIPYQTTRGLACVYMLIHNPTQRFYIGQTLNFYGRLMGHHRMIRESALPGDGNRALRDRSESNKAFVNDCLTTRADFSYVVLEIHSAQDGLLLLRREDMYIREALNLYPDRCYNTRKDCSATTGVQGWTGAVQNTDLARAQLLAYQQKQPSPLVEKLSTAPGVILPFIPYPIIMNGVFYPSLKGATRALNITNFREVMRRCKSPTEDCVCLSNTYGKKIPFNSDIYERVQYFYYYIETYVHRLPTRGGLKIYYEGGPLNEPGFRQYLKDPKRRKDLRWLFLSNGNSN